MLLKKHQIQRVPCPVCGASAFHQCVRRVRTGLFKVTTFPRQHSHLERMVAARVEGRPAPGLANDLVRRLLG